MIPRATVGETAVARKETVRDGGQEHPMILGVLEFPDPRLRDVARPINEEEVTERTREPAYDMLETMYDRPGIGLVAVRLGGADA